MTQEGRVEDFWTTMRRTHPEEDNVRPLLKALAAARRSLDEDHVAPASGDTVEAIVVDIRPEARTGGGETVIEFLPETDHLQEQEAARHTGRTEAGPTAGPGAALRPAARTRPIDWMLVEPPARPITAPDETPAGAAGHPAPEWGDLWRESVQGWVRLSDGTKVWRPIVTTTTSVPNWEIDTNLGMVTGESACAIDTTRFGSLLETPAGVDALRRELADDRRTAQEAMVSESVARGAHAVIGVNLDYTAVGECLIVTATGTAVTLRTAR